MARRESRTTSLPRLVALTPEARSALSATEALMERFPFRVGRDLRDPRGTPLSPLHDRRCSAFAGPNNVYLPERGPRHRLSRQHFLIDREGDRYYLEDRKSACGTLVEGEAVGGRRRGGRRWLKHGDVIIIGGNHSPFVFKFLCLDNLED